MKKSLPFIFCIILSMISCGKIKPDVYIFHNEKLFYVFPDKSEVCSLADRYFRKSGYTVRPVKFAKFTDLSKECDIVKNRTKALPNGAIFFMDNLEMTVFMNNLGSYKSANYKLISYHYDSFAKDNIPSQTLLNFCPAPNVFYNAIVSQIKTFSKAKDYSDVLYIYGSSYPMPARVAELLKEHYPAVKQSNSTSKGAVKSAVNSNTDCKCIIVFDFEYNTALTEIDAKIFTDKTVIEVMTNYGETYPQINRSLLIDEPILAEHALYSKELQRYLADKEILPVKKDTPAKNDSKNKKESPAKKDKNKTNKTNNSDKNVTNVELKHNNIVKVISHTPQGESLSVKLEELIKENNKKKEEAEKKKKSENKK